LQDSFQKNTLVEVGYARFENDIWPSIETQSSSSEDA
jgi:hypothetical protein